MNSIMMSEEFGQSVTKSIVKANTTFDGKLKLEKASGDIDFYKDYMRLRRVHIDTRLKKEWISGKIPIEVEIKHKDLGFHEYNEYICNTNYGETLFIVKSRQTLIQGTKDGDTQHLIEYAKENTVSINNSIDLLDELENSTSIKKSSENQRAFFIICYDVDLNTEQINYIGLYTLDSNVNAIEVQNFSHYIEEAYNMDEGGVIKNDIPPTSPNDYNLELRKQEKKNE